MSNSAQGDANADNETKPRLPLPSIGSDTCTRSGICPGDHPSFDNLGAHTRTVTTSSPLAQRYFNQGLQLANAFGRSEAAQSFREAQRHDSNCAMCYWGEAWALGPYINEAMDSTAGVQAYRAIQKAKALAGANRNEQALIEAMATRYVPIPTADNRARLDSIYADAMRDVVRRFPDDLDAGALLGEALMVLSPWNHWTHEGQPQPGTEEALAVLESVLARDIKHPGACHHYIHLVEGSPMPERAEACADHLAAAIPGASHIQHMPSHIYMNIGRYGDGVRRTRRRGRSISRLPMARVSPSTQGITYTCSFMRPGWTDRALSPFKRPAT